MQGRTARLFIAAAVLWAIGCGDDGSDLFVQVITDLSPGIEFTSVRTEVFGEGTQRADVVRGTDFLAGVRVAEFDGLATGDYVVAVELLDRDGAVVIERDTRLRLTSNYGLTVILTRNCTGVTCPGPGDDPTAAACLGGRCVPETCSPETPDLCPPPDCMADGDCSTTETCAVARCVGGACLAEGDDSLCAPNEWCSPDEGCLPVPTSSDAGTDTGIVDSSVDADGASPDASVPIAGGGTVAEGADHTCVVRSDGSVWCAGGGTLGQLGDGLFITSPNPVQAAGIGDALAVAAMGSGNCALHSDGTVSCWGSNGRSLGLGPGMTDDVGTPTPVPGLSDMRQIAAGNRHACGVRADETVRCWGVPGSGRLGDGGVGDSLPVSPTGLSGVAQVAAGFSHSCALHRTGAVDCWGIDRTDYGNTPVSLDGVVDGVEITASSFFTCVRRTSGQVSCWGEGVLGMLGDGTAMVSTSPVDVVGLSDATAIAAGGDFVFASRASGEVVAWGDNGWGQLGDGTMMQRNSPVSIDGLMDVISFGPGRNHACIAEAARVLCMGRNAVGQHGNGTSGANVLTPTEVGAW